MGDSSESDAEEWSTWWPGRRCRRGENSGVMDSVFILSAAGNSSGNQLDFTLANKWTHLPIKTLTSSPDPWQGGGCPAPSCARQVRRRRQKIAVRRGETNLYGGGGCRDRFPQGNASGVVSLFHVWKMI
jgi:hypothetical protein